MAKPKVAQPAQTEVAPKGNFITNENPKFKPGSNRPQYEGGYITNPGDEAKYPIEALWVVKSKSGVVISGNVGLPKDMPAAQRAAIKAQPPAAVEFVNEETGEIFTIEPGRVVLYTNTSKAENEKRPDYFGRAVLLTGETVKVSAWDKPDLKAGAGLAGSTETFVVKDLDPTE